LKPIIAELYATPQDFAGRVVAVYGVVVESSPTGAEFLLQDVSQRPLKVIGSARLTATVGDQVTIIGRFNSDSRSPYLTALVLAPTRVLGGGGCC
jgi:hypothetical protein